MKRLIRGGRLLGANRDEIGDLLIDGSQIEAVGGELSEKGAEVVDARGLWVMPGVIDTQVHFREPGLTHKEDLESGTRAALMGGVTTIFEMPNTDPPTVTAEALADKLSRAEGRAWCDHAFFVGASPDNIGSLAELEQLPGTPGIKIFMGSSTGSLLIQDDETLEAVLRSGVRPCPVHAEDEPRNRARKALISANPHPREHPFLRDAESARLATERLLNLSNKTGRPVHVLHVSTQDELPMLMQAKQQGLPVTCEVTPQHLAFWSDQYETLGSRIQMNPPIRSAPHHGAIWAAFESGLFDVFGSDHAPHTAQEKSLPYPNSPSGMPGVQTMLPVLLSWVIEGVFSAQKLVRMASERPAELYGIKNKGFLEPGYDADVLLIDPLAHGAIRNEDMESKCGWTPFAGRPTLGAVEQVYLRGELAVTSGVRPAQPSGHPVSFLWKQPL